MRAPHRGGTLMKRDRRSGLCRAPAVLAALALAGTAVAGGPVAAAPVAAEPAKKEAAPTEPRTRDFEIYPGVMMEFVWIPPGEFVMGSPFTEKERSYDEGPRHPVTITEGFWLGRYEVTQEQWTGVMGSNPALGEPAPDIPIQNISFSDAQDFVMTLNEKAGAELYRLPTEAEWEYACRAGTETAYYYGDNPNALRRYAIYNRSSGHRVRAVGQRKPNPWGLYDMYGNVWEWCSDWYAETYSQRPQTDPQGPPEGSERVIRGGSWGSYAPQCRSAFRGHTTPLRTNSAIGLRLVREAAQDASE
ncbi:MAG: SUMF1/EgtB/PvdO family nonheme iron enzyme [Candidatus Eisenbacteria bacterium]|nr:SUMF1/EgtB/PvdO family nonheme iron enzyme [Candidatus Eisenbacteria bacterium]